MLSVGRIFNHVPGARYVAGILGERLLGFGFAQRRRRLMIQYADALGNRVRTVRLPECKLRTVLMASA
jgi:hypothetical protein